MEAKLDADDRHNKLSLFLLLEFMYLHRLHIVRKKVVFK